MSGVIGTAEILITPNTAGFATQLEADSSAGFAGIGKDAEAAGVAAGSNLRSGVVGEAGKIEGDLASSGERAGANFAEKAGAGSSKLAGLFTGLLGQVGVPIGGISSKMGEIGTAAEGSAGTASGAFGGMGGAALAAGAVIAGVAVDFGLKMNDIEGKISAAAGITSAKAKEIGDAFLSTAGTTEFTGAEMGTAYATVAGQFTSMYGKALDAAQALKVMTAAGELATASGTDLTTSTKALVGIMQSFGLGVGDAAHASDILYNTSRDTGLGVDQVAASLEKLRAKLGDTSPPMGALSALMVDMTNHGITGRAAITGVNSAMTGLISAATGTTKANVAARDELAKYGVQAVNAKGQITPLSTVITELSPKFKTMTQAQQLAAAATIFGASAAKDMVKVIDAGPDAYDKASASVNKMGAAHDAAAKQDATLAGEGKILLASLEDIGAIVGQALVPAFQLLVGVVVDVVKDFMTFAGYVGDVLSALGPGKDIILGIVAAIAAWTIGQYALDAALEANPIALIITAIAALVVGVVELVKHFGDVKQAFEDAFNFISNLASTVASAIVNFFSPLVSTLSGFFSSISDTVTGVWNTISDTASSVVSSIVGFFTSLPGKILDAVSGIASGVANTVWDVIKTAASGLIDAIKFYFVGMPEKIYGAITGIAGWIKTNVFDKIGDFASGVIDEVAGFFKGLPARVISGVSNIANSFKHTVLDPIITFVSGAIDSIVGFFTGLPGKVGSAALAAGKAFVNMLGQGLSALAGMLESAIKAPINAIIGAWDSITLPSIHLPFGLGTIGGGHVPQIQKIDVGGSILETGIAVVHKGEVVVPASGVLRGLNSGLEAKTGGGGHRMLAGRDLNITLQQSRMTANEALQGLAYQLATGVLPDFAEHAMVGGA